MPRRLLASLLLASSLIGCSAATSQTTPAKPVAVAPVAKPVTPVPAAKLDRAAVRAELAARREIMFERFIAYREGRVYPVNDVTPGFQHVWLDSRGNLCAAATLISQDWGRDATIAAVGSNNTIALATVKNGPLADWMLTSGLTHQEIVAIQEPGFNARYRGEPSIVAPVAPEPTPDPVRTAEIERLYNHYVSVERQLRTLWDENLDLATDALVAQPALAASFLSTSTNHVAGL